MTRVKADLVRQIRAEMKRQGINKATLVRRLGTSKPQVNRVLDPLNQSLTLKTLVKVAIALDMDVDVRFVTAGRKPGTGRAHKHGTCG